MSENFELCRKIGFRSTFYKKCINVIIDSIRPSNILRSIYCNCNVEQIQINTTCTHTKMQQHIDFPMEISVLKVQTWQFDGKYVIKRVSIGSKDCTKELKLECAYFLGQTS